MTQKNNEKELENRVKALQRKTRFELENGLRETENKIGGYYKYDHKTTASIGVFLVSMAVILKQGVWNYLYTLFGIKILKDTVSSGFKDKQFDPRNVKLRPLIFYVTVASVIIVAALTNNHSVPGFESGLTHYGGKVIP